VAAAAAVARHRDVGGRRAGAMGDYGKDDDYGDGRWTTTTMATARRATKLTMMVTARRAMTTTTTTTTTKTGNEVDVDDDNDDDEGQRSRHPVPIDGAHC
jgi:hypothetical protein